MAIARMLFALVIGGAAGAGAFFLSIGLLPEFRVEKRLRDQTTVTRTEDGFYFRAPEGDSPELIADKRRYATCLGTGCAAGVVACLAVYFVLRPKRVRELPDNRAAEPGVTRARRPPT